MVNRGVYNLHHERFKFKLLLWQPEVGIRGLLFQGYSTGTGMVLAWIVGYSILSSVTYCTVCRMAARLRLAKPLSRFGRAWVLVNGQGLPMAIATSLELQDPSIHGWPTRQVDDPQASNLEGLPRTHVIDLMGPKPESSNDPRQP